MERIVLGMKYTSIVVSMKVSASSSYRQIAGCVWFTVFLVLMFQGLALDRLHFSRELSIPLVLLCGSA